MSERESSVDAVYRATNYYAVYTAALQVLNHAAGYLNQQLQRIPNHVDDAHFVVTESYRAVEQARELTVHVGDVVRMNRAVDTREIDEIIRVATKGRYTSFIG